jgi:hypothetical protein
MSESRVDYSPDSFYFETYWGTVLFSSYSDGFWGDRLRWFEIQSAHGRMGTMDDQATGNGVIVCKDGSPATTVNAAGFSSLAGVVGLAPRS